MTPPPNYIRCNRTVGCPVCGRKNDGCMVSRNGLRAWCVRTESSDARETGWVHKIDADAAAPPPASAVSHRRTVGIDIAGIARRYKAAVSPAMISDHADQLGVGGESLRLLDIGWSSADAAFSFPMRDHAGDYVGVRLRNELGQKWSARGGREGLFYSPLRIGDGELFVCEGPTDTAAMLDMGVSAVGRPSCTGGVESLLRMLRRDREVVIVADHDGPGLAGARSLADAAARVCGSVRIIRPTRGKDAREWVRHGLNADALRRVAMNSSIWTPSPHTSGGSSRSQSSCKPTPAAPPATSGSPSGTV